MRRTMALFVGFGLLGVFIAPGCGDDGNTSTQATTSGGNEMPPPATAPVKLEELGTRTTSLFCGLVYSCCTPMEQTEFFNVFPTQPKNQAECEMLLGMLGGDPLVGDLSAGVMAGRLEYNETLAGSCFEAAKSQCNIIHADDPFSGPGCENVFVGLVPDGGDCATSRECAVAGHVCDIVPGDTLGKCIALPPEGQPCTNDEQCADGLICAFSSGAPTCFKPLADGGNCSGDWDCSSRFCDSKTNLCAPRKTIGSACTATNECVDGAYCEMQSMKCAAQKAGNEACTVDDECLGFLCEPPTNTCVDTGGSPQCAGM